MSLLLAFNNHQSAPPGPFSQEMNRIEKVLLVEPPLGADDLQVPQSRQNELDGEPGLENAENGAEDLQNDDGHPDKNPAFKRQ